MCVCVCVHEHSYVCFLTIILNPLVLGHIHMVSSGPSVVGRSDRLALLTYKTFFPSLLWSLGNFELVASGTWIWTRRWITIHQMNGDEFITISPCEIYIPWQVTKCSHGFFLKHQDFCHSLVKTIVLWSFPLNYICLVLLNLY